MFCVAATVSRLYTFSSFGTQCPVFKAKQCFYRMAAAASQKFQLLDKQGDLFSCPSTDGLVHCVSKDLKMGKGIAVIFKNKFGGLDELKAQGKDVGDVAVLKRDDRFVYYLITKPHHYDKPTYDTLRASLKAMKSHCQEHQVSSLSMPRIGCGLDKLEWDKVSDVVKEVFGDTAMAITVYTI
ncbi:ADP-ribose glycohydrolase OARD1-like [Babylonia areolata]|uniref:ADP-ribose glycohydrolase OARD1-like n=1 Tax=Babylonia areolata TaxID=304850 RepID=UPI003FCEED8C